MHSNGTKVHNIIHLSEKLAKTIGQKFDTNNQIAIELNLKNDRKIYLSHRQSVNRV